MASPLKSGKQSVNLASQVRVSKIRRDPPPVVKKTIVRDPDERDTRTVVIGVVSFAIAFALVAIGISNAYGTDDKETVVQLNL